MADNKCAAPAALRARVEVRGTKTEFAPEELVAIPGPAGAVAAQIPSMRRQLNDHLTSLIAASPSGAQP
eukprot:m51a1_g3177 hypothetical protein (69) ;mRNA; r:408018-408224